MDKEPSRRATGERRTEIEVDEMPGLVRDIRPCKQAGADRIDTGSSPTHLTPALPHYHTILLALCSKETLN